MPHISASQVGMIQRCPKQWEYRYDRGLIMPPAGAMYQGKIWHKTLEMNYEQKIKSGEDLPEDVMTDGYAEMFEDGLHDEEVSFKEGTPETLMDQGIEITRCHHKHIAPTVEPKVVEGKFNIPLIGDWTILGFIDLIDKQDVIIDNKSMARKPSQTDMDQNIQLGFYSLAYRENNTEPESGLRFDIVTKTKTPKAIQLLTERTNEELDWLRNMAIAVVKQINTGVFMPNPNGWHCTPKWCGYWDLCKKNVKSFAL